MQGTAGIGAGYPEQGDSFLGVGADNANETLARREQVDVHIFVLRVRNGAMQTTDRADIGQRIAGRTSGIIFHQRARENCMDVTRPGSSAAVTGQW